MSHSDDVPGSVRIRTSDENEWRFDAIESAADYYDCNRSDAVAYACEDVLGLVEALETVLNRGDLVISQEQRREIAATFSENASEALAVTVSLDVTVESDP